MDLGMAAVNWETMMLEYAGANNPLYVVRRGELQELKPNKFAICSFEPNTKNYDVQKFPWNRATRCSWPRTGLWTNSAGRMARNSCAAASGSCWWKRLPCR